MLPIEATDQSNSKNLVKSILDFFMLIIKIILLTKGQLLCHMGKAPQVLSIFRT